ncbi:MAG: hypothetical protein ABW133_00230 [Polyangiaceae bacterium]
MGHYGGGFLATKPLQPKPKSSVHPHRESDATPNREAPGPGDSHTASRDALLGGAERQGEEGGPWRPSMFPRGSGPAPRAGSLRPDVLAEAARRARLEEPTVLDAEPGAFLFGAYKNIFVGVWESQATMNAVERMVKATNTMSELHPTGRSTIHIVVHGAALPTAEVRGHFVSTLKSHADQIACVAVVVGGTGFWTSALRSFVTGLRWLSPRSFDFRLCGSTYEVSRWLPNEHNKRTGIDIDPKRLVQVLDDWASLHRRR